MAGCGQILVVESPSDPERLYPLLLELGAHEVTAARTFAAAVDFCSASSFDLLLCDTWLPDGDGYSLLAAVRKINPQIRAILVTRNSVSWAREAALAAGFSAHLLKPVRLESLKFVIDRVLSRQEEPGFSFLG